MVKRKGFPALRFEIRECSLTITFSALFHYNLCTQGLGHSSYILTFTAGTITCHFCSVRLLVLENFLQNHSYINAGSSSCYKK
jgi:hypothetical protein